MFLIKVKIQPKSMPRNRYCHITENDPYILISPAKPKPAASSLLKAKLKG